MKKAILCAAVAGIAAAASAQTGSLSIVASQATVDWTTTSSFTLSVFGDADFGSHLAGGAFAINSTGIGSGAINNMVGSAAAWGGLGEEDQGYAGGGTYNGLIFGQVIFLPFIAPDAASALGSGPVLLGSVVVSIDPGTNGVIDFTTAEVQGVNDIFVLEVFDDAANPGGNPPGESTQLFDASIDFGSTSVNLIPAPSAMALLGLGGLVAGRRRR
ncbi:MAG: PEP-CTERM sorting domain-containing protein [Phycisphaerales bacterium]